MQGVRLYELLQKQKNKGMGTIEDRKSRVSSPLPFLNLLRRSRKAMNPTHGAGHDHVGSSSTSASENVRLRLVRRAEISTLDRELKYPRSRDADMSDPLDKAYVHKLKTRNHGDGDFIYIFDAKDNNVAPKCSVEMLPKDVTRLTWTCVSQPMQCFIIFANSIVLWIPRV